ncbi:N-acetyltransferase family protein [Pseudomonas sp. LPB0260]|uniref:GNAT family N-acetyltransferase n=1 Tax=Pseudomonas sp. LPB0260 TaxID=2614442 RepID=UPI0015C253FC|nr:GNAT family N-acetyltransferase [Pseudomonas sp. LPB0260]QLC73600.1 N-acetyltransferase family protein [Pseudomonas sp. LPB0260]QLC76374.1 N-acetyltransferase family protein [Pseudomonas sp. LPB0260]
MSYTICDANAGDLPGILAIYNDAVQNTTAIWNETLVDLNNRSAWLAERRAAGFPVLVARDSAGQVLGYASYGTWRSIEGFRHTVEHSVYVRGDQRGRGLGPALMQALIERARGAGLHVLVAAIESGNTASIRLHERLGFVTTGQMPQVGRKFDRWLDLTFMQLILPTEGNTHGSSAPDDPATATDPGRA